MALFICNSPNVIIVLLSISTYFPPHGPCLPCLKVIADWDRKPPITHGFPLLLLIPGARTCFKYFGLDFSMNMPPQVNQELSKLIRNCNLLAYTFKWPQISQVCFQNSKFSSRFEFQLSFCYSFSFDQELKF